MPDPTQAQINMWDLTADGQLTQADADMAVAIGIPSIASQIESILSTGAMPSQSAGGDWVAATGQEMTTGSTGAQYTAYTAEETSAQATQTFFSMLEGAPESQRGQGATLDIFRTAATESGVASAVSQFESGSLGLGSIPLTVSTNPLPRRVFAVPII